MKILSRPASFQGSNPLLGKILIGTSALTAVLSAYNYLKSRGAHAEVEFRKAQLSKPVYKLSDDEMINPPWNKENIKEWLYRRGKALKTQLRSLADPFTGCSVSFPGPSAATTATSTWSQLSPARTKRELRDKA